MRKNKKGSIEDLIAIAGILFVFAILSIVGIKVYDQFKNEQALQTNYSNATFEKVGKGIMITDNLIFFVFISLAIVMIILASLVRVHPIFFFITFIVFIIVLFISIIFSNAYEQFSNSTIFSNNSITMTKTNFLLSKLPWFIAGLGFILLVVMYASARNG